MYAQCKMDSQLEFFTLILCLRYFQVLMKSSMFLWASLQYSFLVIEITKAFWNFLQKFDFSKKKLGSAIVKILREFKRNSRKIFFFFFSPRLLSRVERLKLFEVILYFLFLSFVTSWLTDSNPVLVSTSDVLVLSL